MVRVASDAIFLLFSVALSVVTAVFTVCSPCPVEADTDRSLRYFGPWIRTF